MTIPYPDHSQILLQSSHPSGTENLQARIAGASDPDTIRALHIHGQLCLTSTRAGLLLEAPAATPALSPGSFPPSGHSEFQARWRPPTLHFIFPIYSNPTTIRQAFNLTCCPSCDSVLNHGDTAGL